MYNYYLCLRLQHIVKWLGKLSLSSITINTFEVCLIFQEIGIDLIHQVSVIDRHGHLVLASYGHGNDVRVGKEVSAHEQCQPNGMCFHLLHDNMCTGYHHRIETDTCLEKERDINLFYIWLVVQTIRSQYSLKYFLSCDRPVQSDIWKEYRYVNIRIN